MSLGERSVEDDRESDTADSNRLKSDLEIVTSSGRGKNGALCVLQSSIKLHIITSFGLSGKSFNQQYNSFQFLIISLKAVWTVYDESSREDKNHTFMVLSQDSTTMVSAV